VSPRVAAVILAKDAVDRVPLVVEAVQAQTVAVTAIVVVDNGSRDGTAEWVRSQPAVHAASLDHNLGVGAGHNHGWAAAIALDPTLTFIWSLEHDTIPEPDCLERLLTTFATEQITGSAIGAVVPKQRLPDEDLRDASPPFRHWTLTFNGTLFSTTAIAATGPIREDFFVGHEDREYAARLAAEGFVIVKDPRARVVHGNKQARRRARPTVLRAYYSNRNEAYLMVHVRHERFARLRVVARTIGGVSRSLMGEGPKGPRASARVRASIDGVRGSLGEKHYRFLNASD
jgi:GT2 family glycosyltransferase